MLKYQRLRRIIMSNTKILTIQDVSCVGQCSLTVALPIISACGIETAILPSAVLSTHTAGFKNFTFRDLSDDMPAIFNHWQDESIAFEGIYTGYLGSFEQIDLMKDFFERYKRIEAINERMKDIHRENPMLVNYIEKCKADSSYFKNLSCMDSCVVAEYCGLSKQRDILRDTSFSLNHYADYFLQYTTKYNILDINEIDYTLLDSLIKENLIKNDIFEFPAVAIFDITQKEVLYCNNNKEINNLNNL